MSRVEDERGTWHIASSVSFYENFLKFKQILVNFLREKVQKFNTAPRPLNEGRWAKAVSSGYKYFSELEPYRAQ